MEEIVNKFIEEGKREHEEMEAFIREFKTTNERLLKERNNSLSELEFEVYGLRKEKEEAQQRKFLENLKQLHINIPFTEALAQMPKYAKFLKVLLNKLPSKEKDPGSFIIPCDIGHLDIDNALADLGANMREDSRILIILGRPGLATTRAMIYVFNKKIPLRVGSEEVIFDVDKSMKRPRTEDDECYGIDDLDTVIQTTAQELLENDQLNNKLEEGIDQPDFEKSVAVLTLKHPYGVSNKLIRRIHKNMKERSTSISIPLVPMKLTKKDQNLRTCLLT
ncbi:hypothetical protein Tco_0454315 [Tanacetum coccineum]